MDAFRQIEEEKGAHFAEIVQDYYEALWPLFSALWAAHRDWLEAEREEIVESTGWAD